MYLDVFCCAGPSCTDLSEISLRAMKVVNETHGHVFVHSAPLFQVPVVSWAMPSDDRRCQPSGTGGLQVLAHDRLKGMVCCPFKQLKCTSRRPHATPGGGGVRGCACFRCGCLSIRYQVSRSDPEKPLATPIKSLEKISEKPRRSEDNTQSFDPGS